MSNRQTKETFQSLENRTQLEKKLKILYFVAMIVHIISFVMGIIGMLYIFWRCFDFLKTVKYNPELALSVLTAKENFYVPGICFSGFMLERPSAWLVSFAEKPNIFFKNECMPVLRYKPLVWLTCWLIFYAIFWAILDFLKEKHEVLGVLYEVSFPTVYSTFFLSVLCIAILQYYKKLIVHKEN